MNKPSAQSCAHPRAVIIGAGPAGLTAAYELLRNTQVKPIVLEATDDVGGISRTVAVRGNRVDIGGHRFFSKSERVMRWWQDALPVESTDGASAHRGGAEPAGSDSDRVMMVRSRVSRILYDGKLFDYPLRLSLSTVAKLGIFQTIGFGLGYVRARLVPIRPERSLEDFLINRFGRSLYNRFFREYTEKVWGTSCDRISPEWGTQRIKGLSVTKVLVHAVRETLKSLRPRSRDISQQDVETSLIERFLYPRLGPGQLWQVIAERVAAMGGEVRLGQSVVGLEHDGHKIIAVSVRHESDGRIERLEGDYVISTMPVQDLVADLDPPAPADVRTVADGLVYRDFRTAALVVDRVELGGGATAAQLAERVPDNWIYIQEPGVKVGRLQIFNNWSPFLPSDPGKILVGLEYFGNADDALWALDDEAFLDLAVDEMDRLGLINRDAVADRFAVRMPKAYPAYFGTYDQFDRIREFVDGFSNLFLVGRNGMHRYNNQDHSMLTAMMAVEAIATGSADKAAIWAVNTEQDYHEAKEPETEAAAVQHAGTRVRPTGAVSDTAVADIR